MTRPRGFTLVEVLVALTVGGMAVSAAAALIGVLNERASAIAAAHARMDRDANAERILRGLWRNLRLAPEGLRGDALSVAIRSWCETADGWLEACVAHLEVQRRDDASSLMLRLVGTRIQTLHLFPGAERMAFRYLSEVRYGGTWSSSWTEQVLPIAVGLIVDRDTIVLAVRDYD